MRHNICVAHRYIGCFVWAMQENQWKEGSEQITVNWDVSKVQTHTRVARLTSIISTSSSVPFPVLGFFFRSFLSKIARLQQGSIIQVRSKLYYASYHHAPILVQFDGGDYHLARVYTDRSSGAIRLVTLHTVNVDDPFLT